MSEDLKNILGKRIKLQRQKLKIRNIDIAEKLGVNKSTVSNWIIGHRTPESQTLSNLAEVLNTSVDYLTGKTDNPLPTDKTINIRELLENRDLEYDGEIITDQQRETFLHILETIIKPKL